MKKLVGLTTMAAIALTMASIPAQANAAGPRVNFGSQLDSSVQPSNSTPAHQCDPISLMTTCTFVMNEAYGRPDGGEKAPVSGTLKKVRVISGATGSFRLQLVKARQVNGIWRAKVKAQGPIINLQGQDQSNWDSSNYKVEEFKVNMPIRKGWRLSMAATSTSAVRCSSGGDNTLIFSPSLAPGAGSRDATSDDGCWPLIEGVIKA